MPRFPSAQGRLNHEPDSTFAVTKTCPKDGVHLSLIGTPVSASRRNPMICVSLNRFFTSDLLPPEIGL